VQLAVRWIGHILLRQCLVKHIIEGKTEVRGRRTGRRKQPLDEFKEMVGYLKLKGEALDHPLWRTRVVRGCGRVVRVRKSTWQSVKL
jgi:hypothetical protein